MIKTYILVIFLLLVSILSYSQKYDLPGNYGIEWKRGKFDTALYVPIVTGSGAPRSVADRPGALSTRIGDTTLKMWNGIRWLTTIDDVNNATIGDTLKPRCIIFGSQTTNTVFPLAFNHQIAAALNMLEVNYSTTYQTVQRTTLDSNNYSDLQMFNYRIPPYTPGSIIVITNGFEDIRLDSANRTSYPAKYNTQLTTFINNCKAAGYDTNSILKISSWFWLNPSFMPSPALTHQERFVAEDSAVAAVTRIRYVDIFHLMQQYGNQLLRSSDTTYPNQAGHDSITKWTLNTLASRFDTVPKLQVSGSVRIHGAARVGGMLLSGSHIIYPTGNLMYQNEPNNHVTGTDGVMLEFALDSVSPHAPKYRWIYEYKDPQNTGFTYSFNCDVCNGFNVGINGNQYDLTQSSLAHCMHSNIWSPDLIMGANNPGIAMSYRVRRPRTVSTATSVPFNFWLSNSVVNTSQSSFMWLASNNFFMLNELADRRSAYWEISATRLNLYDTLKMPNLALATIYTRVAAFEGDAMKYFNLQSLIDLKQNLLSSATVSTRSLEPVTDDTYYLGENDSATPHAYKGIIIRDQGNGDYYRLEMINGVFTPTLIP